MTLIRLFLIFLISAQVFAAGTVKFGIASAVPEGTPDYALEDLYDYLSEKLGRKVEPVVQPNAQEIDSMVENHEVDFASVCSTTVSPDRVRIIAIPEINGTHSYKTYIIANKKYGIKNVSQLKGRTFAFTDKLTGSGSLYPSYLLIKTFKKLPDEILKKSYYTQSNEQSIYLVYKGVVDAAAVDGAMFEAYKKNNPKQASAITVIHRSPVLIAPPFVASSSMDSHTYTRIKNILLKMDGDPEGRIVLNELSIDRFVPARYKDYENLMRIKSAVDKFRSND